MTRKDFVFYVYGQSQDYLLGFWESSSNVTQDFLALESLRCFFSSEVKVTKDTIYGKLELSSIWSSLNFYNALFA